MKLYCATGNRGKLREFALAAAQVGGGFDLEMLPGYAEIPPCPETGATFEENALQKAEWYGRHAPGLLFADDSGLEVDALGGAPGVRSARYAGEGADDEANNRLLLQRMAGRPDRTARFVCVIALADRGRVTGIFRGAVEGVLLDEPRGAGGFGYDPLFFYPPYGQTLAEVDPERKLQVSHRGQALRAMLQSLRRSG